MILVGPSLGAAVAIDFAVNHPEAVSILRIEPKIMHYNSTLENLLVIF